MTDRPTAGAHRWRFFRSGGFDQVRIETVDDLRALGQLDLKLWASLACPVQGLEFDARTLRYIDSDGDGRVRVPEVLAAVRWALDHLTDPEVLFAGPGLPLAAIRTDTAEGASLLASARHILRNLGRPDADRLTTADTDDLALLFPAGQTNGDGLVPASLSDDPRLQALIEDIIASLGGETDRSGAPAVSEALVERFFAEAEALEAWRARRLAPPAVIGDAGGAAVAGLPEGDAAVAAIESYEAVAEKIEDFFMRSQFAAYDARAATLMNGSEAELGQLAAQTLHAGNAEALRMPLAQVRAGGELPLGDGVNPAWADALGRFRAHVVTPLLGARESLTLTDWRMLRERFGAHLAWLGGKPETALESVPEERLRQYLACDPDSSDARAGLQALIAADLAVAAESDATLDADRLVRYQRHLVPLLNNFVAFRDFYSGSKAVFQSGTLFLDGRSFDLCVQVNDAARHATLAALSRSYLLYCDCRRKDDSKAAMTIVAAVTAGGAGNLMAGRNGVFYDRQGNDWDATIARIVENPVSLRDAFWAPYRRIGRMISEQAQKFAAAKEQAVNDKASAGVAGASEKVAAGAAAPAPGASAFDIGKFVGIFAAIGLALGAIGTALATVVSGLLGLPWWQLPLVLLAIVLLISGPAVVLAWFKLRQRNLAPILDANGWAVNTEARINIPFGTALTHLARLPRNASRSWHDPHAGRRARLAWLLLGLLLAAGSVWGWQSGFFSPETEVPGATAGGGA